MPSFRELKALFADFDRRQRPDARSRNRVISKYASINDTVTLSSDAVTTSLTAGPWQWSVAASTTVQLIWGEQGEWS